jgi:hypothetical protein
MKEFDIKGFSIPIGEHRGAFAHVVARCQSQATLKYSFHVPDPYSEEAALKFIEDAESSNPTDHGVWEKYTLTPGEKYEGKIHEVNDGLTPQ